MTSLNEKNIIHRKKSITILDLKSLCYIFMMLISLNTRLNKLTRKLQRMVVEGLPCKSLGFFSDQQQISLLRKI